MADPREELARVVHDLRNPVAVIEGFARLLERDGERLRPEQRTEYAARIAEAAQEMRELLDGLSGSGRPGP